MSRLLLLGGGGEEGGAVGSGQFDGITWPLIRVYAAFGATTTPAADVIRLGVGPGLGTGKLGGGLGFTDITADTQSISISMGRASDVDPADPGTCTLLVDNRSGNYDPDNTTGPYSSGGVSLIDVGVPVQVVAEFPPGTVYPLFDGEIADIAPDDGYDPAIQFTCTDGLEKLGRARLTTTGPSFDGDKSGARLGHILDAAAWPTSKRTLDTGYATLGPTTFGDGALELARKVERTEFGLLFCDGAGNVVFYDRFRTQTATRSTTSQANFTDTAGANEIEMTALQRGRSRERTFNDWHIIRDTDPLNPADSPVEQVATDQTSKEKLGLLSGPSGFGELLRTDEEALGMAQGLLPWFKLPATRIREVRVDAITQGRWAQLLPLTLLDKITVSRDYGPVTVAKQLLIQKREITIRNDDDNAGWDYTFTTTPPLATQALFTLGTSQLGSGVLGW